MTRNNDATDTREAVQQARRMAARLVEDWDQLNDEEKIGTVSEIVHQLATAESSQEDKDMDEPTEPRRLEGVMSDNDPVELGDVVTFPEDATDCVDGDNQRWIVLHPDDYENHAVDVDGNVGVLVGPEQTRELYRLCVTTMLALEHPDGCEGVIRDLIGTLEEVIDE